MNLFAWNLLGARVVLFALAALIGLELADISWRLLPGPVLPIIPQSSGPADHVATQGRAISLASVSDSLRLFNPWENPLVVQNKPLPPPTVKEVAVESNLELSLIGVMILPKISWAILIRKATPNNQVLLRVGEKVDGATLKKIERNAVYFDNRGRMERIVMLDGVKQENTGVATPSVPAPTAPSATGRTISRAEYDAMLAKGMGLLAGVNVTPFYQGTDSVGYRVKFPDDKAEFNKIGLASDDVIQQVNGISVTDTAKITQLANQLKSQTNVKIGVLRDNAAQVIELNIEP